MTAYSVHLKTADHPVPVSAEKFVCESDGYTVFYVRPSKLESFEEAARFLTNNIKRIEEN